MGKCLLHLHRCEKKNNPLATCGTTNFRRSTLEHHACCNEHRAATEAKVLRRYMNVATEKVWSNQEKAITSAMKTAYFVTQMNLPISHYREMIEFFRFQGKT